MSTPPVILLVDPLLEASYQRALSRLDLEPMSVGEFSKRETPMDPAPIVVWNSQQPEHVDIAQHLREQGLRIVGRSTDDIARLQDIKQQRTLVRQEGLGALDPDTPLAVNGSNDPQPQRQLHITCLVHAAENPTKKTKEGTPEEPQGSGEDSVTVTTWRECESMGPLNCPWVVESPTPWLAYHDQDEHVRQELHADVERMAQASQIHGLITANLILGHNDTMAFSHWSIPSAPVLLANEMSAGTHPLEVVLAKEGLIPETQVPPHLRPGHVTVSCVTAEVSSDPPSSIQMPPASGARVRLQHLHPTTETEFNQKGAEVQQKTDKKAPSEKKAGKKSTDKKADAQKADDRKEAPKTPAGQTGPYALISTQGRTRLRTNLLLDRALAGAQSEPALQNIQALRRWINHHAYRAGQMSMNHVGDAS